LARSPSVVLLAASFVAHLSNFVYYFIAGRAYGQAQFGAVGSLISLATVVFTPFTGVQVSVARDIARLRSADDPAGRLSAYLRHLLPAMGKVLAAMAVILAALTPVIRWALHLDGVAVVVCAALWMTAWAALLILAGVAQGSERFGLMSFIYSVPQGVARPLCLLALFPLGLVGSTLAMLIATMVGLAVMAPVVRALTRIPATGPPVRLDYGGAITTLIGFTVITNIDQVVARALLPAVEAGYYSSAAVLGKIAFFAPAALAVVLLPRVTAAYEAGQPFRRPFRLTYAATAAAGLAVTLVFWLAPPAVMGLFGPGFGPAHHVVGPVSLVMTGAALLNVHINVAIASNRRRLGLFVTGLGLLDVAAISVAVAVIKLGAMGVVAGTGVAVAIGLAGFEWINRRVDRR
jgi:O-antigen/teichoic acid export membrane protein